MTTTTVFYACVLMAILEVAISIYSTTLVERDRAAYIEAKTRLTQKGI